MPRWLKEDYKKCMEDLKKETQARTHAETLAKVLKDTLQATNDLEESNNKIEEIEDMEIQEDMKDSRKECDSDSNEWKQQRKQRKRSRKSVSEDENIVFNCDACYKQFESETDLKGQSDKTFAENKFLMDHIQIY